MSKSDSKDRPLLLNTQEQQVPSDGESGACFLCLEGDMGPNDRLLSCCTRCNAMTHYRCWHEYRYNQRVASLRARLLHETLPRSQLLCSICKTGEAKVQREDEAVLRSWMYCGEAEDSREEEDFNDGSQDLVDVAGSICSFRVVIANLLVLLVAGTATAIAFAHSRWYSGDVFMIAFTVGYESLVVQIVFLFILTRRRQRLRSVTLFPT